jgi:hypothetical protein
MSTTKRIAKNISVLFIFQIILFILSKISSYKNYYTDI